MHYLSAWAQVLQGWRQLHLSVYQCRILHPCNAYARSLKIVYLSPPRDVDSDCTTISVSQKNIIWSWVRMTEFKYREWSPFLKWECTVLHSLACSDMHHTECKNNHGSLLPSPSKFEVVNALLRYALVEFKLGVGNPKLVQPRVLIYEFILNEPSTE